MEDQGGRVPAPQPGQHQPEEGQVQPQGPAELPPQQVNQGIVMRAKACLLYTSPSPRDSTSS
eukprot:545923-Prorocentrum_lima.AAC.1